MDRGACRTWSIVIFVIENVVGILRVLPKSGNSTRYIGSVLARFQKSLPYFKFRVHVLNCSLVLPQNRERVYLCGMRKDTLSSPKLPDPLPLHKLPSTSLFDFLYMDNPNVDVKTMSLRQQINLATYETRIRDMWREKGPKLGMVAVFDVERAWCKAIAAVITFDIVPCLTINNRCLFLMSVY